VLTIETPAYGGGSLLNVPPTICRTLGASIDGLARPLDPALLPPALLDGVGAVVLVIVDGLGRWQLDAAIRSGDAPTFAGLHDRAASGDERVAVGSLTSVFPSSTMPALATLNTGLPPAEHGLLGWTVYLEEFGEPSELARWGPADRPGSYADHPMGEHDPAAFFGRRTLYQRLGENGVRSVVVGPATVHRSGFSRMVFQGAELRGHYATSSLFVTIDKVLAESTSQPSFVYGYWPSVDTVGHYLGPLGEEHAEEITVLDFVLGRWLARARPRRDVLLLITADHGHVASELEGVVRLDLEPELLQMLICRPTGERRLAYLHARAGLADEVHRFCADRLTHAAELLDPADAFARGLFGPGPPTDAARRRAGDLILLAREGYQFICPFSDDQKPTILLGNHGALDEREMLVPLLAVRM
jgi:hypothetical protein